MEIETIYGQVIAKANNYQAVPGKDGQKRIIKNDRIREYEKSFCLQCKRYRGKRISGRFKLFIRVWHGSIRFDLDNALKTILDCLQTVEAITKRQPMFRDSCGETDRSPESESRVWSGRDKRAKKYIQPK